MRSRCIPSLSTTCRVLDNLKVAGCPKGIEDKKYDRNSFIFNFVFVFDADVDVAAYESVIRKLGAVFHDCEVKCVCVCAHMRVCDVCVRPRVCGVCVRACVVCVCVRTRVWCVCACGGVGGRGGVCVCVCVCVCNVCFVVHSFIMYLLHRSRVAF